MRRTIKRALNKVRLVLVMDEVIFAADVRLVCVYAPPRIRAIRRVSGMHDQSAVDRVLPGRRVALYDKLNGEIFAEFLKEVKRVSARPLSSWTMRHNTGPI